MNPSPPFHRRLSGQHPSRPCTQNLVARNCVQIRRFCVCCVCVQVVVGYHSVDLFSPRISRPRVGCSICVGAPDLGWFRARNPSARELSRCYRQLPGARNWVCPPHLRVHTCMVRSQSWPRCGHGRRDRRRLRPVIEMERSLVRREKSNG